MALQGFDGIAAITQDAINFQLLMLQKLQVIPTAYTDSRGQAALDVTTLGPPTVQLVPPGAGASQVMLTLPCIAGSLTYWDVSGDGDPVLTTAPVDGITLAYLVDLSAAQVDQAQVQALQQAMGSQVQIAAPLADFTDDLFSISQLFLDFESLDISRWDQGASQLGTLPTDACTALATFLVDYQKDNPNGFILGFAVAAKDATQTTAITPVFAPTYASFLPAAYDPALDPTGTSPDPTGLSTLSWRLMFGNLTPTHQPPASPPDTWGVDLVTAADEQEQVSGVFLVSQACWYADYIVACVLPVLAAALGSQTTVAPAQSGGGWVLTDTPATTKQTVKGPIDTIVWQSSSSELVVSPPVNASSSTVVLSCAGTLTEALKLKEHVPFPQYAHMTTTMGFSLTLTLAAAADGTITVTPSIATTSGPTTSTKMDPMFKIVDFFSDAVSQMEARVGARMAEVSLWDLASIKQSTTTGFAALSSTVVFPAADFFFKDLQVDGSGNLALRVTIKS